MAVSFTDTDDKTATHIPFRTVKNTTPLYMGDRVKCLNCLEGTMCGNLLIPSTGHLGTVTRNADPESKYVNVKFDDRIYDEVVFKTSLVRAS